MSVYDRKDSVYREAKKDGLRSRAAIKLKDLDRKFHIFAPGQKVVDLGCWPGGWLQVAAQSVGERGLVVGVDLAATESLGLDNVVILVGDAAEPAVRERLRQTLAGPADVVLCDMAPKLSGVRAADQARHEALAELALVICCELLGADGKLVIKLFSQVESQVTARLKKAFSSVTKLRPQSTRKGSSETYAVARGRR